MESFHRFTAFKDFLITGRTRIVRQLDTFTVHERYEDLRCMEAQGAYLVVNPTLRVVLRMHRRNYTK